MTLEQDNYLRLVPSQKSLCRKILNASLTEQLRYRKEKGKLDQCAKGDSHLACTSPFLCVLP